MSDAVPKGALRTCRPDCRSCETTERIGAAAHVLEEAAREQLADAMLALMEVAGRKDPLGARLAAAFLGRRDDAADRFDAAADALARHGVPPEGLDLRDLARFLRRSSEQLRTAVTAAIVHTAGRSDA